MAFRFYNIYFSLLNSKTRKLLLRPKTHSKGVTVISHLKPEGLKCNLIAEQNSKIFTLNFKTKHPSTKIHYPYRLQTQINQVLTNFHNIQISTSNLSKKIFKSSISKYLPKTK